MSILQSGLATTHSRNNSLAVSYTRRATETFVFGHHAHDEPLQYPWPRSHSVSGCVRHGRKIESAMISDSLLSRSFVSRSDKPKCWKDTNLKGTKANLDGGNGCVKVARMNTTRIAFKISGPYVVFETFLGSPNTTGTPTPHQDCKMLYLEVMNVPARRKAPCTGKRTRYFQFRPSILIASN